MAKSKPIRSSSNRWHTSFQNGELEIWVHFKGFSLWVDTAQNRWELNGHTLFGWVRRSDPLDTLKGLPAGLSFEGLYAERIGDRLSRFLLSRTNIPLLAGPMGWAALVGGILWALGRSNNPLLLGVVWILLGAELRGMAGIAYGFACLLLLGAQSMPMAALFFGVVLLLIAQGFRCRRAIAPFLGAAVLLLPLGPVPQATPLQMGVWLIAALGSAVIAMRPLQLCLGLDATSAWKYHCQVHALKALDNSMLWSLNPQDELGLPPEPAYWTESRWRADNRSSVVSIGNEYHRWIFLPGIIIAVQAGVSARLHEWSELSIEGHACHWESRPPGLPDMAWVLKLNLKNDHLFLLFGDTNVGQAFQDLMQTWAPASAPEPMPTAAPTTDAIGQALSRLGLQLGANWAQIRAAYRQEVRRSHPDQYPWASQAERGALDAKLKDINSAMDYLETVRSQFS